MAREQASRSGERRPARRRVRALFAAVLALALWAGAELLAWAGLWIVDGRPFDRARLRAERAALSTREDAAPDRRGDPARRPSSVVHPYVGWVGNPRHPFTPGPDQYEVNEYGFPDARSPLQRRAPDRLVVGIVGGSMALRFGALGTAALAAALARSPRFADREIVFVRLGAAGYKQPQQLMAVSYLLSLGAEFDLLIALDGFNEVALYGAENAAAGVFPAFPRKWHLRAGRLHTPIERRLRGEVAFLRARRARWAERFSAAPWSHSAAANLLWRFGDRRLEAAVYDARERLERSQPPLDSYERTGPPSTHGSRAELYAELAEIWRRSSEQLHHLSEGNGVRYLHFLQPNQYVAGSKPLSASERREAFDPSHPYAEGAIQGYPLLVREGSLLRARGVRFHDLTQLFADVTETLYQDTCCHLNARGHALLAGAIARAILEDEPADAGEQTR